MSGGGQPDLDEIEERFAAVAEGRISRDDADRWAARWVTDDELTVDEFLIDGARAYVRLTQVGRHLGPVDGIECANFRQSSSGTSRSRSGRISLPG